MIVNHLLIDANNIGHIAAHSMPKTLSNFEKPTAVLFGFLSSVLKFQEVYKPYLIHFCWDSRKSYRKLVYAGYKEKRNSEEKTQEELEDKKIMYDQFTELRKEILPELGFANIHMKTGFEGDDIIAAIAKKCRLTRERCIIVSTDHDLYQLISPTVYTYNPITQVEMTPAIFEKEYGVTPDKWALVKAYAGCASDEIIGVKGVGEKTAIKYINGTLPETHKTFQRMESKEGQIMRRKNYRLTSLPFMRNGRKIKIEIEQQPELLVEDFKKVFIDLGFDTFMRDFHQWERAFLLENDDIPY